MTNTPMLLELCTNVMKGAVGLDEYYQIEEKIVPANPFEKGVLEDIVEAIEHTPGKFLSSKIDLKAFHQSEEFHCLRMNYVLLKAHVDHIRAEAIRSHVKDSCLRPEVVDLIEKIVT